MTPRVTPPPLDTFLARDAAHAQACFALDEGLGQHHGLAWADFVLLRQLDTPREGGMASNATGLAQAPLAKALGTSRSRLLLRLRPLQKVGLLQCSAGAAGLVTLTPAGRRLLREAGETAAAICVRLPLP